MPKEGLEPSIPCEKRILSPPRIPFRHLGLPRAKSGGAAQPSRAAGVGRGATRPLLLQVANPLEELVAPDLELPALHR
jgi:hypothetical protein